MRYVWALVLLAPIHVLAEPLFVNPLSEFHGSYTLSQSSGKCHQSLELRVSHAPSGRLRMSLITFYQHPYDGLIEKLTDEFSHLNEGWVPWSFKQDNEAVRGQQKTTLQDHVLEHEVKTSLWGARRLKRKLILMEDILEVVSSDTYMPMQSSTCIYKKKVISHHHRPEPESC